jgi:hypothetical protein
MAYQPNVPQTNLAETITATWTFNNTIVGSINGNAATATTATTATTASGLVVTAPIAITGSQTLAFSSTSNLQEYIASPAASGVIWTLPVGVSGNIGAMIAVALLTNFASTTVAAGTGQTIINQASILMNQYTYYVFKYVATNVWILGN